MQNSIEDKNVLMLAYDATTNNRDAKQKHTTSTTLRTYYTTS
jgi:hypothetical protein